MEQDPLLYSLTLFTFCVIFFLCFIRHKLTFFERNRIARAGGRARFPFGDTHDVVFLDKSMFFQLWKFHLRLRKRRYKTGGFYVYLEPCIIVADENCAKQVVDAKCKSDDGKFNFDDGNNGLGLKVMREIVRTSRLEWNKIDCSKDMNNLSEIVRSHVTNVFSSVFHLNGDLKQILERITQARNRVGNFNALFEIVYFSLPFSKKWSCKRRLQAKLRGDCKLLQILGEDGISGADAGGFLFELFTTFQRVLNLVVFVLFELGLNVEIQDEARGEISRFLKEINDEEEEDLQLMNSFMHSKKLSYLKSIIKETLRKYPLQPFLYKTFPQDLSLVEDFVIKAGTPVFVSIFGIHHDSSNYTNPELFDPDRFSEENDPFVEKSKYYPNDSNFVNLVLASALVEMISKYKFSTGKKTIRSLRFEETCFDYLLLKEDLFLKVRNV